MKDSGKCMKCGSERLLRFSGASYSPHAANMILVGLTRFSAVPITRIVCAECGYVEQWVEGRVNLEKLMDACAKDSRRPPWPGTEE